MGSGTFAIGIIIIFAIGFIIGFLVVMGTQLKNLRFRRNPHLSKDDAFDISSFKPDVAYEDSGSSIDKSNAEEQFNR